MTEYLSGHDSAAANSSAGGVDAARWVVSWAAAMQGPYPIGNSSAMPDMSRVFAEAADGTRGARDQTFRLIVRPTLWGREARIRFSNALGTRPVTFDGVFVGLQAAGAQVTAGTNRPITFDGKTSVTIAPGQAVWSDAVTLPFVRDPSSNELAGRKLAVSFDVVGESGPMTWHAKALQSSYVTWPGAGAKGNEENETNFPVATAAWFFLDALDMRGNSDAYAVVAFGDSITDGTASTMNGDDRWPDVLERRLRAVYGNRIAVVNAGIGGNQVVGPAVYPPPAPLPAFPGGPSALSRLARDVLSLSGVRAVIWLEGINDFSRNGNATFEAVANGMREGVAHMRKAIPGVRVIGATVVSALGSTSPAHGFKEQDDKRRQLNEFFRTSGVFDGVADFDKVVTDAQSGAMRAEFVPDNTVGGPGDKLHPNRLGYLAMGQTIDLKLLAPH
ncbi:MAG: lysophospholipase [Betaproteobacteria bacterium]|nr:lysophospholipase [Betaproteobacteria bacterium]